MTPDPLSPVGLLVRALLFGGILAATGAVAFHFFVIRPLSRRDDHAAQVALRLSRRAAAVGTAGAVAVVLMALARLKLQAQAMSDPALGMSVDYRLLILETTWGRAWIAQLFFAGLFLAARNRWPLSALAAFGLAFTPAFSGHAIGSERLTALAVAADGLHVLGAGGWLGAMLVLAMVLLIPRHAGDHTLAVAMIAAFSPLALSAAATVTVSGALSGLLHVGSLEALTGSRYGRTLLVKVGLVIAVVFLGAFNWKRAGPRVIQHNDERPMLRSIRAELGVGLLVLLATAPLVVTPPPGEE